jgi:hypothetical protein
LVGEERMEIEAVAAAFERTPRLVKLLRYLGEKYFASETEQLTEYNVAIHVFERNPSMFIASEDAIARVETHRLRKKLKAYYETEGREHSIQITIPLGSYSPVFCQQGTKAKPVSVPEATAPENDTTEENPSFAKESKGSEQLSNEVPPAGVHAAKMPGRSLRLYWVIAVAVLILAAVIFAWVQWRQPNLITSNLQYLSVAGTGSGAPQGGMSAQSQLRMIFGYFGPPQRDSAGEVWQPDQFHTGGWSTPQPSSYIDRTSDQFLFRYGRFGDFDYKIPLKPGAYELHLYAVSLAPSPQSEDSQVKTVFQIDINGQTVLDHFDPLSDAMGINIADERVVRGVLPAADGILHIHVSTIIGTPSLNAIAVLPGLPNKQLPVRIVMQNAPWTDHNGQIWHPDTYFLGGRRLSHNFPDAWATDAGLYSSERYGHFSYAIPVDPRDRYTVVLHFVELFFGVPGSNSSGPGQRIFRVLCNGSTLLDNFDIARETGSAHPLTKVFNHIKPTAQGKLNLTFEPIKNYATVSAIEVLDESN